jgi:hypothetical protein
MPGFIVSGCIYDSLRNFPHTTSLFVRNHFLRRAFDGLPQAARIFYAF